MADIAHVLWAVNLGCLGLHLWPYRADDPAHADELRIDLDPQPGTSFDEVRLAQPHGCTTLLDELGIVGYPEDDRQPRPARLRPARAADGTASRSGPARWPWPGSWSAGIPT